MTPTEQYLKDHPCEVCGAPSVMALCDIHAVIGGNGIMEAEIDETIHTFCCQHTRESRTISTRNPALERSYAEGLASAIRDSEMEGRR